MVLEAALNELVQQVGCDYFMDVGLGKMVSKRLYAGSAQSKHTVMSNTD